MLDLVPFNWGFIQIGYNGADMCEAYVLNLMSIERNGGRFESSPNGCNGWFSPSLSFCSGEDRSLDECAMFFSALNGET
ncbi:unnamed protein product [Enterobius vermicularis]|uniref:Uncharacterized protein n=1 Tax=Enterobius vermicularis TaxID=51028 RepID=A0A0N4VRU9_ENTVE|nr:unnamed protein product [Enterobius vermicularis]